MPICELSITFALDYEVQSVETTWNPSTPFMDFESSSGLAAAVVECRRLALPLPLPQFKSCDYRVVLTLRWLREMTSWGFTGRTWIEIRCLHTEATQGTFLAHAMRQCEVEDVYKTPPSFLSML